MKILLTVVLVNFTIYFNTEAHESYLVPADQVGSFVEINSPHEMGTFQVWQANGYSMAGLGIRYPQDHGFDYSASGFATFEPNESYSMIIELAGFEGDPNLSRLKITGLDGVYSNEVIPPGHRFPDGMLVRCFASAGSDISIKFTDGTTVSDGQTFFISQAGGFRNLSFDISSSVPGGVVDPLSLGFEIAMYEGAIAVPEPGFLSLGLIMSLGLLPFRRRIP